MYRRQFLSRSALGLGSTALTSLLAKGTSPDAPVKRVIYLAMSGGPPHVDLFDDKKLLRDKVGEALPAHVRDGQRLTTMTAGQKKLSLLPSVAEHRNYGKSGIKMSSWLPHIGSIADEMTLVRSMYTEAINHAPAFTHLFTGSQIAGRPAMGAWATYGLGTENENLPSYVVLTSRDRQNSCGQLFYDHYWGSGFLPSRFQGVKFRGKGDPVLFLGNPEGISRAQRKRVLGDLAELNEVRHELYQDPEIETRIAQYEMAFRMQSSVPELADLDSEPKNIREMYGEDVTRPGSFARNCLLARRLVERGSRFVQVMHAGWDHHSNINTQLAINCKDIDQPAAALVKDLKQRGLLDDTLVIFGGEFGRTPFCQGDMNAKRFGRDHHNRAFSIWMAGGSIKKGHVHGHTDDYAYNITDADGQPLKPDKHRYVEGAVHIHDLQATILHQLGIDHTALTYKYQGRRFRLTDVHGHVVKSILA
ncbi:MAG: DUF1501 domain-containing protein [Akkermansiaceae bacterium]